MGGGGGSRRWDGCMGWETWIGIIAGGGPDDVQPARFLCSVRLPMAPIRPSLATTGEASLQDDGNQDAQ